MASLTSSDFQFQEAGQSGDLIHRIETGQDNEIIRDLSVSNGAQWMDQYTDWFGIYTLQHRYAYNFDSIKPDYTTSRPESYCLTNNHQHPSPYISNIIIGKNCTFNHKSFSDIKIERDCPKFLKDKTTGNYLNGDNYLTISNSNMYSDRNLLNKYSFSGNVRTAAALNGSFLNAPVTYNGYIAYFGGGEKNIYPSGKIDSQSLTSEQYSIYTLGGAPINENNWLIEYCEFGIGSGDLSLASTYKGFCYETTEDKSRFVLNLYIHLFLPNGVYVRTRLDRSGKFFPSSFKLDYWAYEDYSNSLSTNFSQVWNSIVNGTYKKKGKTRDSNFNELKNGSINIANWWNSGQNTGARQVAVSTTRLTRSGNDYNPQESDFRNGWTGGRR